MLMLSPAARMLLQLLRHDGEPAAGPHLHGLPGSAWEELLQLALSHGVAPLLSRALREGAAGVEVPEDLLQRIAMERRATGLLNLRKYAEFRRIAQALRERGIPFMPLKGLHLAELAYRDISLRPMSDLDILVPQADVQAALAAMRAIEYGFDEDLSDATPGTLLEKCNIGLAHRRLGLWLEVHWTLAEPGDCYAPPMDEVWHSAAPARVGDVDVQVMSPEFVLLHVCAHLACNHGFGFDLRALCDIAEIARGELDWQALAGHGRRHGWTRGVAAALRLARDHLGAQVPDGTLSAFGADVLERGLLAAAMEHLVGFPGIRGELVTAPNLLAVAAGSSGSAKLALLCKRIFVSRAELSLLYGVPQDSARLGLFYAVRARDLMRKYAAATWALKVSDPRLAAVAARHARLADWVAGG